jgi:hypothetical protein
MRRRSRRIPLQPSCDNADTRSSTEIADRDAHPEASKSDERTPASARLSAQHHKGRSTDSPKETDLLAILFTLSLTFAPHPPPGIPRSKGLSSDHPRGCSHSNIWKRLLLYKQQVRCCLTMPHAVRGSKKSKVCSAAPTTQTVPAWCILTLRVRAGCDIEKIPAPSLFRRPHLQRNL